MNNLNLPWSVDKNYGEAICNVDDKIIGELTNVALSEHIVKAVNTLHQLEQMGIDDPVSWSKKQVDDAFKLGVKHGEELAEKDRQIAELKNTLDSIQSMAKSGINEKEYTWMNPIFKSCSKHLNP